MQPAHEQTLKALLRKDLHCDLPNGLFLFVKNPPALRCFGFREICANSLGRTSLTSLQFFFFFNFKALQNLDPLGRFFFLPADLLNSLDLLTKSQGLVFVYVKKKLDFDCFESIIYSMEGFLKGVCCSKYTTASAISCRLNNQPIWHPLVTELDRYTKSHTTVSNYHTDWGDFQCVIPLISST